MSTRPEPIALPPSVARLIAIELPVLCARVREVRATPEERSHAIHDLAGTFALLGEVEGRALARSLEERLLAAEMPARSEIERLLALAEAWQERLGRE